MIVRMVEDWPPPVTKVGRAAVEAAGYDAELPRILAGSWGEVIADIGGDIILCSFGEHEIAIHRDMVEEIN